MSETALSSVTGLYQANLRSPVALDIVPDGHTVLGEQARKRAKALEDELTRRGVHFDPIVWRK